MSDLNSLISEEEYLPLPKQLQPTPASKWTSITPHDIGDPALRLTPDKICRSRQLHEERDVPRPREDVTLEDGTEKDSSIQFKPLRQEGERDNVTKSHQTSAWVEKHGEVRMVYNTGLSSQVSSENQPMKVHKSNRKANCSEPIKTCQREAKSVTNKQKKLCNTQTKLKPILHKKTDGKAKAASGIEKHVRLAVSPSLDKPLLNSTSALASKLQELDHNTFNRRKAVSKSLSESEETRSTLAERAADGVNIPKHVSKYPGLISVDIPKQDVLDQAVEEKLKKLTCQPDEEEKKRVLPSPNVMDVFTPDLIVEYPDLDVSFLTLPQPRLHQVPMEGTFDLYRKICTWEK